MAFAWLSVTVKEGLKLLKGPKIVKCNWEESFGEVLGRAGDEFLGKTVLKILIAKSDTFSDALEVSIDAPVVLCQNFCCKFISYEMKAEELAHSMDTLSEPRRSAVEILMNRAREIVLPDKLTPLTGKTLRGDQTLYNDVLDMLVKMKVGWSPGVIKTTGEKFVKALSDALWTLDPHHKSFADRSITIPSDFHEFSGYNDWQRKKQKKPQLTQAMLKNHMDRLSDFLMQPWFCLSRFDALRSLVEKLLETMHQYILYLEAHNRRMIRSHQSPEPIRSVDQSISVFTVAEVDGPTKSEYTELEEVMLSKEFYDPVFLNDLSPKERYQRRHWLENLHLQFPIMMYRFAYGSSIGTLCFAWRVPGEVDQTRVSRAITKLTANQKVYATRAMRSDFLNKYNRLSKISKAVLRNMFKTLMEDNSACNCAAEKIVDDNVALALFDLGDPGIVLDLRSLNGDPKSTKFNVFWQELSVFLEESAAVDERRHSDILHMPFAVSIRHLREVMIERLDKKFPGTANPIPSEEWIRLQFWPSNPYSSSALKYTGQFKVKYGVQIRQLRKDHPDGRYVNVLQQYAKDFALKYKSRVGMISVDDKAIIPVGEPGLPVSTGVRGHNRSLVSAGHELAALDHDFHVSGLVPSVVLVVDLPDSRQDSFFQGRAYVTLKDKVTQASSAMRHSAETMSILHQDGTHNKPILLMVSDGGPDHRVTFGSVKMALIALFRALNLDMLVAIRTCPYQSWRNLAERVMSVLNLALQNVSLSRKRMEDHFESMVQNKSTLGDLRAVLESNFELRAGYRDSMDEPIRALADRFRAMKLKDEPISVNFPATGDDITDMVENIRFIEPSISEEDLSSAAFNNSPALKKFVDSHCHSSHYAFQIKKCLDPSCYYCVQHPIVMDSEEFSSISFLPLPLLDGTKEHFSPFSEVYGKPLSDKDRPSRGLFTNPEAKECDKNNKALLINSKVRCVITCQECRKPRCVFAAKKLDILAKKRVDDVAGSKLYTCGSFLFPPASGYSLTIVARQCLTCQDPIEVQYYSSTMVAFPQVCYHCGAPEETLLNDIEIIELKKQFAIVRPICFLCRSSGKRPSTRQPNLVAKKLKS